MPCALARSRRWWSCALLVLGSTLALGAACRPLLGQGLLRMIQPDTAFDDGAAPPPPDYRSASAWAALPARDDGADRLPAGAGVRDGQATAETDCFYLHGTTYADSGNWNQPLYDEVTNARVDALVLPVQAAVFNGSCRVFAPRYRQATLYAFRDASGSGAAALDLAYHDVEAAFVEFAGARSQGRPFVLAGHSQGTLHLLRLLRTRVSGTPLRDRLVIAYLPGWSVDVQDLLAMPDLPVCGEPDQTGCLVSWNAEAAQPRPAFVDLTRSTTLCVNPLTWTHDGQYAGREFNLGGLILDDEDPEQPLSLVPQASDAQCVRGGLRARPVDVPRYRGGPAVDALLGPGVYHNLDYNLFYMNIRHDVAGRVAAHRARSDR